MVGFVEEFDLFVVLVFGYVGVIAEEGDYDWDG